MSLKPYHFETLALHAGQVPDATLSRGVPVYRTTSYLFKNTEHAANLFALKELGNIYTRLMNPTTDVLEQRITQLEGGAASVAHSKFGIKVNFVDPKDPKNFEKAITPKTRALFIETIGNPALDYTDVAAIAEVAHNHGIPLIVDGTFTTPYLLRTIELGADIVINSLTKWLGGHGSALGGSITDSGKFNWKNNALFTEPDANYHGLRWAIDLPAPLAPIAFALRVRTVALRNLGASISPDNSWLLLQGIETLPVRMVRHCENALKVAEHLKNHPKVSWVRYPGLKTDPSYSVASKYLKNGFGGMVVFGIKGGYPAAIKLIDNIKLVSHLANVGDAKSLILHPASTSHSQLSEEQQREGGLTPDLIRLSIGLEHIDDIIAALDDGLSLT